MRVHELAKDLGLSSKELIDLLARLKVSVKSHSSSLDESTVRRAREQVAARGGKAAAPAAPAAPPRADVKTPTGERIISIRKIAAPPVQPPAEIPAVPALRAAGTPEPAPVEQPAAGAPAEPAAAAPPPPAAAVPRRTAHAARRAQSGGAGRAHSGAAHRDHPQRPRRRRRPGGPPGIERG